MSIDKLIRELDIDPAAAVQIKQDDANHVFHSWSAQSRIEPLPIAGGLGSHFWDYDGNTYLDFASQLVYLNLGHQHPKLVEAIQEKAGTLATAAPPFAEASRSQAAKRIAQHAPNGLNRVFFTNGGAEANENALRMARLHTGRQKVLSAYRSYHGATAGAIAASGDGRRWPSEPAVPGVVHFWGPYLYRSPFFADNEEQECSRALAHLRATIEAENPDNIAAILLESVVGTNGLLPPPAGYLAGVRSLCDEFGIVFIADEVMAGFGRCGEWFAINHWHVIPDLISFAKGSTSGYVPLGGVIISDSIAQGFDHTPYPGGLTYSGHLLGCAAAVASVGIFEEEGIIDHARCLGAEVLGPAFAEMAKRHDCIGEVRGLGVFWALELVCNPQTREAVTQDSLDACIAYCHQQGLWPLPEANRIHIVPPCNASVTDIQAGLAVLDEALTRVDQQCVSVQAR